MIQTFLIALLFLTFHINSLETSPYIKSAQKLEIPVYKYAFNPSIIEFNDGYLLAFRLSPFIKKNPMVSKIGLILLDKDFNPIGNPQLLKIRQEGSKIRDQEEDPRLIQIKDKIYISYNDNPEKEVEIGGKRDLYLAEVVYDNFFQFSLRNKLKLTFPEKPGHEIVEKNWAPFEYEGELYFSYSISPHEVIKPDLSTGICEKISSVSFDHSFWKKGILRGSTPSIKIDNRYVTFFHSSQSISTSFSFGRKIKHYFFGAMAFEEKPPFKITHMSHSPLFCDEFFNGTNPKIKIVFPAGIIVKEHEIIIVYGRDDYEMGICRFDKQQLLDSLKAVQ